MRILFFAFLATTAFAEPRIFYSKSFPGSAPPYVEILLERDGSAMYKEAPDDPQPVTFKMERAEADVIYGLASKLDHFTRPLEAGLKVAQMGMKTYRWEEPPKAPREVKYNYSSDLDAQAIQDWFERMVESVQLYLYLERAVKFDKLGTNKALLLLQAGIERNRVVSLPQFLPLLDRVVKNHSYLNMARERAAALADMIRAGKPKAE